MVEPGDARGRTPGQSEDVVAVSSGAAPKSIAAVDKDYNVGSDTGGTPGEGGKRAG